jgi:hypothetical protein
LIKGDDFSALFESVFPILKAEWESLVNAGDVLLDEVRGIYSHMVAFICLMFSCDKPTFFVYFGIVCSSILKC